MRIKTIFLPLLLIAAITTAADIAKFTPWKGSMVKISGTSTLHDWTMEGSQISGGLDMARETAQNVTPETWQRGGNPLVVVTIPVNSLKSEHEKMDKIAYDALKMKQFPQIRYELLKSALLKPGTQSFVVGTHGKLTIAGVTKEVDMNVTATRNDKRMTIAGEIPIRMTDYGIKPPTAMMGTIKSGNDVKVAFRWVVEETN